MDYLPASLDNTNVLNGPGGTETRPATPALAVLSAKLKPPTLLPGWIDRRALLDRLAVGCVCRLTLITAPAGYGKSTLAAQFVWRQQLPGAFQVVWLTLDAEDDDPAQFLTCLTAALTPLDASLGSADCLFHQSKSPAGCAPIFAVWNGAVGVALAGGLG